jgi:HPt (histidine-containing phosphotransfer) domain-containing protein
MDEYLMNPPDSRRPSAVAARLNDVGAAAATTRHPPAQDVSDRVLARVGGDRALLAEISRLFIDDAPGYLASVRLALDASNGEALRRAAHTLKGAAANFDAEGVVAAARALEAMGTTAQFTGREPAWRVLTDETDRLLQVLRTLAA